MVPAQNKILEKAVFDQIQEYFQVKNPITNFQHAYRKGQSTCTVLVQMTDVWYRALDNQMISGPVLLDFTAAFDVIHHKLLLEKIECYRFRPSALAWMGSYLVNRSQKVFFNGSYSDSMAVECGVPQGSCQGPLCIVLFLFLFALFLFAAKYFLCVCSMLLF